MTTAEVELLERAKQSIANDPEFTMAEYEHCLANHLCRAAGHEVVGVWIAGTELTGHPIHVRFRAPELVPLENFSWRYLFQRSSLRDDKEEVFRIIDQLVAENYVAEPELVGA